MSRKNFDYESLDLESRQLIHDALSDTTMKHVAGSDFLSSIPLDMARYYSQRLEVVHLEPALTSPEEVDMLATTVAPQLFPFLVDELSQSEGSGILRAMRYYLDNGESVHVVVSPHLKIDDLPELSVAIGKQMDPEHWQDQNGEIISRGVTTIGAFDMAASEVVEKTGHVFLSFPRTDSILAVKKTLEDKGIGVDIDSLVDTNNHRMRQEIRDWQRKRLIHRIGKHSIGKSLQIAWEGSTPALTHQDGQVQTVTLNNIANGTYKLVQGDYVLPVVLWSDPENPILRLGSIQKINNERDIENVHNWQAHTLARALGLRADKVTIKPKIA